MKVLYSIIIATLGGLIGQKLKIPAGGLIGAMLMVAAFNIYGSDIYIPSKFRFLGEVLIGGVIGLGITRQFLLEIKNIFLPAVIIMFSVIIFGVVLSWFVYKITGIDFVTCLYACSPGGITNMTVIAQSVGANSAVVSLLQMVRLLGLVTLLPVIINILYRMGIIHR